MCAYVHVNMCVRICACVGERAHVCVCMLVQVHSCVCTACTLAIIKSKIF